MDKDRLAEIKENIFDCTKLMNRIENIEFELLRHGLAPVLTHTRTVKRALIYKQTDYWEELHILHRAPEPKPEVKKKKKN